MNQAPVYAYHEGLEIRSTPERGRGVFARRSFSPGDVIEVAPVLPISPAESDAIRRLTFANNLYCWLELPDGNWSFALVGGLGFFFNHSYEPNADFDRSYEDDTIRYTAIRAIRPGDEVFVNYNGDPDDKAPVWFDVR